MTITIYAASPYQAAELTEIAVSAKGHWGYSAAQIQQWRPAFLTITPAYIAANPVWVAVDDSAQLAGFVALELHHPQPVLEHLWVRPAYIGQGIGRRLFLHAAATVTELIFTSDPNADTFYQRIGAQVIGQVYSTLQQTTLTQFRYTSNLTA